MRACPFPTTYKIEIPKKSQHKSFSPNLYKEANMASIQKMCIA